MNCNSFQNLNYQTKKASFYSQLAFGRNLSIGLASHIPLICLPDMLRLYGRFDFEILK